MKGLEWLYKRVVDKDYREKKQYEEYVNKNIDSHKKHRIKSYLYLMKLKKYYKYKDSINDDSQEINECIDTNFNDIRIVEGNQTIDNVEVIKRSLYFDEEWYRNHYSISEGEDAAKHYLNIGRAKFYSPGPSVSSLLYLNRYADARDMNINPLLHFELYGKNDKRVSSYNGLLKDIGKDISLIENSIFWNEEWYTEKYYREQFYIEKPAVHFFCIGCYLGYNPCSSFSENEYKNTHKEMEGYAWPSLLHYEKIGKNTS